MINKRYENGFDDEMQKIALSEELIDRATDAANLKRKALRADIQAKNWINVDKEMAGASKAGNQGSAFGARALENKHGSKRFNLAGGSSKPLHKRLASLYKRNPLRAAAIGAGALGTIGIGAGAIGFGAHLLSKRDKNE